jgi:NAD(P)-dependent dehydrogenase (short-subunit alcohol dehydrogenase family)
MPGTSPLVAVVAGATRGAGRGIALALGEAGATVYCTGRSVRGSPSAYNMPETIDETAEQVTALGGTGIAVQVDHTDESAVETLFARVALEHKHVDVLADSVAGETPLLAGWTNIWETSLTNAEAALRHCLLSRVITAKHAAKLMRRRKRGLIVEVTAADMPFYGGNVIDDLVKTGIKGLAFRLAEELRTSKVACVSMTPGFLRSEAMLRTFKVTKDTWRDGGKADPHFLHSESPLLIGRAVVALARDREVMRWSGHLTSSWEVAREYKLTDADGTTRDWGQHWRDSVMPAMPEMKTGTQRQIEWLDRIADRLRWYVGESR